LALDARWDALIASEQSHRSDDPTLPLATVQTNVQVKRHAAFSQNR